jgi:hypothetical protein
MINSKIWLKILKIKSLVFMDIEDFHVFKLLTIRLLKLQK